MMQWLIPDQWGEYSPVFAQAVDDLTKDPLIDQGGEDTVYIGILLLIITLTIAIGILSGRVKTAILLALFFSAVLIAIIFAV